MIPYNSQADLRIFWRDIPQKGNNAEVPEKYRKPEYPVYTVNRDNYKNNGWIQFLSGGEVVDLPEGELLRTYSLSGKNDVVILPDYIHAYRALDYRGSALNNNMTVSGYLLLKELTTKVNNKKVGYVPGETGVVLYSTKVDEKAVLVLKPYTGSADEGYEFTKYPNTEGRRYAGNIEDIDNPNTQNRDVNMFVGSYGYPLPVGPVDSWNWDRKDGEPVYDVATKT